MANLIYHRECKSVRESRYTEEGSNGAGLQGEEY